MLIRETDTNFDQHLERIEKSEGEAFFFDVNDNPARFQQKVVDAVVAIEPPEVLLIFHWGCGEKKSRSLARSTARRITKGLDRKYSRIHIFILPPKLFGSVQSELNRDMN